MLELYVAERCPYCVKVRYYFEQAGITYILKPVPLGGATSPQKEELKKLGGKTQVPYLVDPDRKVQMYESDDIIAYVSEHYASK